MFYCIALDIWYYRKYHKRDNFYKTTICFVEIPYLWSKFCKLKSTRVVQKYSFMEMQDVSMLIAGMSSILTDHPRVSMIWSTTFGWFYHKTTHSMVTISLDVRHSQRSWGDAVGLSFHDFLLKHSVVVCIWLDIPSAPFSYQKTTKDIGIKPRSRKN